MPLPTNQEINDGFERRNATPAQSQAIGDIRAIMVQAAIAVRDHLGDGEFAARFFNQMEGAFITARGSVMNDPPALSGL